MLKIIIFPIVVLLCVNAQIIQHTSLVANSDKFTSKIDCECTPINLCASTEVVYDNDSSGKCNKEIEVCCLKKSQKQKRQVVNRPAGCGYRNTQGIGSRRPGAQEGETNFGEIPWMVGIHKVEVDPGTNVERNIYICGGSLINPRAVITAAHCVLGTHAGKRLRVRAGEWDTQNTNEIYPYQDRNVIEINTPKNYRAGTLYNDIAVLILNEPVELSPHVDVICLPQQPEPDLQDYTPDSECFVSGWGKNKAGIEATILKTVKQPTVDKRKCVDILRTTKLGQEFELHFNFMCAGGVVGQDVCGGFGGSPLVCPIPGQQARYYQAGLVSWGIGCGDHVPGVYTNIAKFRNWIDEQMQYKRLNESFYRF